MAPSDARSLSLALEAADLTPEAALAALSALALEASTTAQRQDACRGLGSLAGRAHGASWEVAERSAFVLLEVARDADTSVERALLLGAMARAFRNLWLMPYVHARLGDDEEGVVVAALGAAGGLAFPALEEAIASTFLVDERPQVRLAAIAALGRMGASSVADRLASLVLEDPPEAAATLSALTEIRSCAGHEAALALLAREPGAELLRRAVRYLAETGCAAVHGPLTRLARDDDAELRIAATLASRAYHAERARDPGERILAALTERDRAVRASLARRLRTLPVADVLEQAELLLADDPEGVVQIVAEVRAPEVTRFLLALAANGEVAVAVRARAAGSIEANEAWEREALITLAKESADTSVRVAAVQTLGAFAPPSLVLGELAALVDDAAPAVRGALLWAIQLAGRELEGKERAAAEAVVRRALADEDASVRRRAAYVAGNLDAASLVPELVELASREKDRADLRVAAFVGLGEIGTSDRVADLVHAWNRESDPAALGALSQALSRALRRVADVEAAGASLARARDRLPKQLGAEDPRTRAAAARVAGLAPGLVATSSLLALASDPAPRVREQAVSALGRVGGDEVEPTLQAALDDADPAIQERAALALVRRPTRENLARVLAWIARSDDEAAALRVASALSLPPEGISAFGQALDATLARIGHDHAAYEELLDLKVQVLESRKPRESMLPPQTVDAQITSLFPRWSELSRVRGFAPLARSLRTAEMLFANAGDATDADQSASIVLWTKSMEGYLHAWLAPKLGALQREPRQLWELVDDIVGTSWPAYQRWLDQRWRDPVDVGGITVEIPLRSAVNALRDLSARRTRSLDAPLSVTEWARMMLFLAIDHPSGAKNVLGVGAKDAAAVAELAHRLQVVAQVRNVVTHRSTADGRTLAEFRRLYYGAFQDLTSLA